MNIQYYDKYSILTTDTLVLQGAYVRRSKALSTLAIIVAHRRL